MSTIPFSNFTKGEISPELQARIDTNQYASAARRVRNFIIQRYGGLSFRPGFRLVGEADSVDEQTRYIPFQYNMEQAYMMSYEDERARLLANGGFIVEDDLQITAITKATNAQLTIAFHAFVVGERIILDGIVGMAELNGRAVRVVSVVDANNITIDVDTTNYSDFVSSTGTARVGAPTPPAPDPAPPPAPPPPPEPAPTVGGGGSGSGIGGDDGREPDGYEREE